MRGHICEMELHDFYNYWRELYMSMVHLQVLHPFYIDISRALHMHKYYRHNEAWIESDRDPLRVSAKVPEYI